jgi:hypothetical protein
LFSVLTYPGTNLARLIPKGKSETSIWSRYSEEIILHRAKILILQNLREKADLYSQRIYSKTIGKLLEEWGDLPIGKGSGVNWNSHPFVTVLSYRQTEVMNLSIEIATVRTIEGLDSLVDRGYVPDPWAVDYRRRAETRQLKKSGRILELLKHLELDVTLNSTETENQ